jgi:hypothetical protein
MRWEEEMRDLRDEPLLLVVKGELSKMSEVRNLPTIQNMMISSKKEGDEMNTIERILPNRCSTSSTSVAILTIAIVFPKDTFIRDTNMRSEENKEVSIIWNMSSKCTKSCLTYTLSDERSR